MKIAVVSTDGQNVNNHFGKAESFLIYEAGPEGTTKLDEIPVSPFSTGDKSHKFDASRFDAISMALAGCTKVYCTKIGDKPRLELEKAGITPVIYEGAIADLPV
ncbi:MAG: hypothetical protein KQH63_13915 [Desulfobulbaceae bacterium]|nr:hypothetical protein [Desulfobulbaceae bacterium]